jgi:hypothetical protein
MRVLYNGWEIWITTMGADIKNWRWIEENIPNSYGIMA